MLIKKIINRIVRSSGSPDKNDLWLDDNLNLKVHENDEWKTIAGGGSGGGGSQTIPVASETQLGGVKVGEGLSINQNGVLSVSGGGSSCQCLPPMIVEGTIDENYVFTPGEGAPTFTEAQTQMFAGGLLYFLITVDSEPYAAALASVAVANSINAVIDLNAMITWSYDVEPDMTIDINLYGENYYLSNSGATFNFVELDENDVEEANAVMVNIYKLDDPTPDSYILTMVTDGSAPALFRYIDEQTGFSVGIMTKDTFESEEDVQVPEGVITNDYNYVVVMSDIVK